MTIFLIGLLIGSFLNSVIYRLSLPNFSLKNLAGIKNRPRRKAGFLRGRSHCPKCKHILNWQDLIPVLSFIFLKGKCRYCQEKISWQYPLVEIATGLVFLLIFNFPGRLQEGFLEGYFLIFNLIIACFLIIIFVYDLRHYIIPDKIIYPAIGITLIFNFQFLIFNQLQPYGEPLTSFDPAIFKFSIISAALSAGFFLAIVLITKGRGMGVGDIKLAFFMGLFLGWPNILIALFSAFLLGAIMGIGLIIFQKKTLKSKIPFGPFLVTGTFVALFLGEQIINWYLNLFI